MLAKQINQLARISPFRNKGIRLKLLLSYMLVVLLPYTVIGAYFVEEIRKITIHQAIQKEKRDVKQLGENLRNCLNSYVDLSNDIYFDSKILDYFNRDYTEPVESIEEFYSYLQPTLKRYTTSRPDIYRITIYTKNDSLLTNGSEISFVEKGSPEEELYDNVAKHGGSILWRACRDQRGESYIVLCRFLNYMYNEPGVLAIYIRECLLYNYLKEESTDNRVFVLTPDETIITSNDPLAKLKPAMSLPFYSSPVDRVTGIGDFIEFGENKKILTASFHIDPVSVGEWRIIKAMSLQKVEDELQKVQWTQFGILIFIYLLAVVLAILFSRSLSSRIKQLSRKMVKVQEGNFDVQIQAPQQDEIGSLEKSFNSMTEKLNQLVGEVYAANLQNKDLEIKKREAELYALQSQINPHFLFNTLDAVLMGLQEDREEVEEIIHLLAESFRRSLEMQEEYVRLEEEIGFIKDYLTIQKYRMKEKLNWDIRIPGEMMQARIPRLILQPLVENAVIHGVAMKKGAGTVVISGQWGDQCLEILVEDDGVGIRQDDLEQIDRMLGTGAINQSGRHIGIRNVYDRIKLYYEEQGKFFISSRPGSGTILKISIPVTGSGFAERTGSMGSIEKEGG